MCRSSQHTADPEDGTLRRARPAGVTRAKGVRRQRPATPHRSHSSAKATALLPQSRRPVPWRVPSRLPPRRAHTVSCPRRHAHCRDRCRPVRHPTGERGIDGKSRYAPRGYPRRPAGTATPSSRCLRSWPAQEPLSTSVQCPPDPRPNNTVGHCQLLHVIEGPPGPDTARLHVKRSHDRLGLVARETSGEASWRSTGCLRPAS